MGKEVSSACLDVLNNGMELDCFNKTSIILILKIPNPSTMVNFHPISLCNGFYKLTAKMITNRFRRVLDGCIDKAQSVFVPERLIMNNILLAYELLHTFSQKRSGEKGFMTLIGYK